MLVRVQVPLSAPIFKRPALCWPFLFVPLFTALNLIFVTIRKIKLFQPVNAIRWKLIGLCLLLVTDY